MPRKPCPRAVALENRAFLRHLRATGNAHESARRLGLSRTRFTKRRAADPAFAARWNAALAFADARLVPPRNGEGDRRALKRGGGGGPARDDTPRTVRTRTGLQLRPTPATAITTEAEQRFLLALSATANVRLAARAAGFAHSSFYARKRADPAFAREWRLALERGYREVETALLASQAPDSYEHDAWTHNEPPAVPPMTANQALQLLYLHQKEALSLDEPPHLKRRRGEPREAYSYRLARMYEVRQEREREKFRAAEAARQARGEGSPYFDALGLPDLSQVTGWSKARPQPHASSGAGSETAQARPAGGKADPSDDAGAEGERCPASFRSCRGHDRPLRPPASGPDETTPASTPPRQPDRALFGGWRIDDWREREEQKGRR